MRKKQKRIFGQNAIDFVTQYLLKNYPTHNLKFPIPVSQIDVAREGGFLIRFLNPDIFAEPIPVTRTGDFSGMA